jgi:hypothetical protein
MVKLVAYALLNINDALLLQAVSSGGHQIMLSVWRCQMQETACSVALSTQVSVLLGQV